MTNETAGRRQRGQSLIQVMIVIGIMSLVAASIAAISQMMLRVQNQGNLTFQAANFRQNLISILNNSSAWKNTINHPGNNMASGSFLDCLAASKPCTGDETTDVGAGGTPVKDVLIKRIVDASNNVVYDASNPNQGLSPQGDPCSNFVPLANGTGNNSCPLRFEVHWSAICTCANTNCAPSVAGDTCLNPQVQLQVLVSYNPGDNRLAFNPANYGTPPYIRGQIPGGSTSCWVEGGGNLTETCATFVGINTSTPRGGLDVFGGAILGSSALLNAAAVIDFSKGNIQYTAAVCGAFQLNNLKDGATYMFVVRGTPTSPTPQPTCSFTGFSDGGTTPITMHLPPDHGPTLEGKHTVYNIAVAGSHAYMAWTPGY